MTYVQMLRRLDFAIVRTGGGCTAWQKDFPNGNYVMITCEASHQLGDTLDHDDMPIVVAAYDKDGELINDDYYSGDFDLLWPAVQRFCALAEAT